jgi:hypothetical protein
MNFEKEQVWRRLASTGEYETYYTQAGEEERETFRQWIKSLLWEQKILVEFVKSDGSVRVMECTLNDAYGAKHPERNLVEGITGGADSAGVEKTPRRQNNDVCVAWDVKQGAWRSFRWDRVKKIEFKIGS